MKRLLLFTLGLNFAASHEFFVPDETEILESVDLKEVVEEPLLASEPRERRELDEESDEFMESLFWFVVGLVLIPFAIVMLWKNEKKLVTFRKAMGQGRDECKSFECGDLNDENDWKLVHVHGETNNENDLVDESFGVVVRNGYKLVRMVEMYQWKERSETVHINENETRTDYYYDTVWCSHKIDSSGFHDRDGHENPDNEWPFHPETQTANYVSFGKYRLESHHIDRIGGHWDDMDLEDPDKAIELTDAALDEKGFSSFRARGYILVASTDDNENEEAHVGQYRVWFRKHPCGQVAIMQQQVKDNEGMTTFREWNPKLREVPYGESTNGVADKPCCDHPIACCVCKIVNYCFNSMFEETVDVCQDGHVNPGEWFANQAGNVEMASKILRIVGIVALIAANYMLWMPWIKLLNMIPLVGWLLSGIASFAAFIWSCIVGFNTAIFVIAVAWVFFRPLVGICLLVTFALGIYLIFFFPWEKYFGDGEVKQDGGNVDDGYYEDEVYDDGPATNSTTSGGATNSTRTL